MAESYISELGDSLSHGVANTNGDRVKIIAPKLYNDGNGNHPSIATALSGKAASNHTHGNIANGGTLQTNDITIANGDKLVVTDSSDSSKVARASIAFDGSTTTQALTKAGTWATFNNYSHPAGSAPSKTGVPIDNATPGFGGTFKVNQITTDATSHVSAVTERTITIPNATATTSIAGLMSAEDKRKLDGIATGAEVNVQADWNSTNSSSDSFIKNKPYFNKSIDNTGRKFKVCTVPKHFSTSSQSEGIEVLYRRGDGAVHGELLHKAMYELYLKRIGDISVNVNTVKFYYIENPGDSSYVDIYADSGPYCSLTVAPLANLPKNRVDFTAFGDEVPGIPEGATEITPVWVANSASSSGTAPVKVDAYGTLIAVPMDSIPTASSTNLMTSGAIKTALDNAVANGNKRYPFGVRQNRTTSYGYRLFNVKFNTAQSAANVRISGNIVVGTTGNNEHISFDLVIANVNTVENNPSSINLLTTSTRRGSRVVRLAYKRPSNWNDGLDVFILWNAEGTATAANDTYGWEITQQEATKPSGVEVKDENLTSALTGFTLDSPRTFAITEGTSAIGSTSVPVYANVNGVITPCTDDFVHDGDVTSTYSSTGTAPVNGTAVAAAINALDVTDISGFGTGKTLSTLKEENGKISATFQDISITKSQVSDFSHAHGNIKDGGTLQTDDITIANGDKLVVTDASDSNKVARASLTFDGATTNQMLSKKGEWSDTIAKARAVVDYGSPSNAIEIGWAGDSVNSPTHFAVYTNSEHGYKAIKDCNLLNARKAVNGTSKGSNKQPTYIDANGVPTAIDYTIESNVPSGAVFTDTKQRIVASDSKTYLTGVTTAPTSSNQDLTGVANANVYATAGHLHATTFDVNSKCTLQFNTTTNALDFVFA